MRTDDLEALMFGAFHRSRTCAAQMIWGVHTFSSPQPQRQHACFSGEQEVRLSEENSGLCQRQGKGGWGLGSERWCFTLSLQAESGLPAVMRIQEGKCVFSGFICHQVTCPHPPGLTPSFNNGK